MGRPRIKIIDDAQEAPEKASKKKTAKAEVKSESVTPSESTQSTVILGTNEVRTPESDSGRASLARMTKEKKPQKPGKAKPRSKKYQEAIKDLDRTKAYSLLEAVDMAKKLSYSKFNATLEAHINTAQTGIRGLVSLPYAKGKKIRILCFGPSNLQLEGVVFGSDSTIEEIDKGKVDFDLILTTPEWMPKLAKVARILGPRGLMPNPKNGTIASSEDGLKKAVESFQAGKTEYKTESKAPVIHLALGKINQPNEELVANIKTLYQTIGKSRIKKISLSPTMGPSVKINLTSL